MHRAQLNNNQTCVFNSIFKVFMLLSKRRMYYLKKNFTWASGNSTNYNDVELNFLSLQVSAEFSFINLIQLTLQLVFKGIKHYEKYFFQLIFSEYNP